MSWLGQTNEKYGSDGFTDQMLPTVTNDDNAYSTSTESMNGATRRVHDDGGKTAVSVGSIRQHPNVDRLGIGNGHHYDDHLVESVEEEEDEYYSDLDDVDPDADLQQKRLLLDQKLKTRFETIFEKYGRDFSGVGDEIDLRTGQIVVDNGHIFEMANEQDAGDHESGRRMLRALTAEPGAFHETDDPADSDSSISVDDFLQMLPSTNVKLENVYGPDVLDVESRTESRLRRESQLPEQPSLTTTQGQGVPSRLPPDTAIIAQFGSELGRQIIQHINEHRSSEVEPIESAWQTSDRAVNAHGRRPILQSLLVQPEVGQRSSPPNVSLWAPSAVPKRLKKHSLQQRHDREHYRNPMRDIALRTFNDENDQRAAKRMRRIGDSGHGSHGAHGSMSQASPAPSLAGRTPSRTQHSGVISGTFKSLNPYRNMFTRVEDEAFERRIKETVALGYNVSHACYMNLHFQFPHHTAAAWKNRYRTKFKEKYPRIEGAQFRKEQYANEYIPQRLPESMGSPSSPQGVELNSLVDSAIREVSSTPSIDRSAALNAKVSAPDVEDPAQGLANNSINNRTSPQNNQTHMPDTTTPRFSRVPEPPGSDIPFIPGFASHHPEKPASPSAIQVPTPSVQSTSLGINTSARHTRRSYSIEDAVNFRAQKFIVEAQSCPPVDEAAYAHAVCQFAAQRHIDFPAVQQGILTIPDLQESRQKRAVRTPYGEEDDQFMLEFLACIKPHIKHFRDGRHWEDLEFLNPKHSHGSWRSRWSKHYFTLTLNASDEKSPTTENPLSPPLSGPMLEHPTASTALLVPCVDVASSNLQHATMPDDLSRKHIGTEADQVLLDFVQNIQSQGLPVWAASSQDLWEAFATRNPIRSARRWKNRYGHILYGSAGNLLFKSTVSERPVDPPESPIRPPSCDRLNVQRTSPSSRLPDRTLRSKMPVRRPPGTLSWTDVLNTIGETDPILHASLIADGKKFNDTAYTAPQPELLFDSALPIVKKLPAREASLDLAATIALPSSLKKQSEKVVEHSSRLQFPADRLTYSIPRIAILDPPHSSKIPGLRPVTTAHTPKRVNPSPSQAANYTRTQIDSVYAFPNVEDDETHGRQQIPSSVATSGMQPVSGSPRRLERSSPSILDERLHRDVNQSNNRKSTNSQTFRGIYDHRQTSQRSLQQSEAGTDYLTHSGSSARKAPSDNLLKSSGQVASVVPQNAVAFGVAPMSTTNARMDVGQEQSSNSSRKKMKSSGLRIDHRNASSPDSSISGMKHPQTHSRPGFSVILPGSPKSRPKPKHNDIATSKTPHPASDKQAHTPSASAVEPQPTNLISARRVIPSTSDIETSNGSDDDDMDELSILPYDTPLLRVAQPSSLRSTPPAALTRSRPNPNTAVRSTSETSQGDWRDDGKEEKNKASSSKAATALNGGMGSAVSMHASAIGLGWGSRGMR